MKTLDTDAIRSGDRPGGARKRVRRDGETYEPFAQATAAKAYLEASAGGVGAGEAPEAPGSASHCAPALSPQHVSRPRLVRALQQEQEATTFVLAAPPGYGKSSLLCEWAEQDERPFAWLELAPDHDDPSLLLSSLAAAIGGLFSGERGGASDGGATVSSADEPTLSDLVKLARLVATDGKGAVLVLDDVQELRSPASREIVTTLARQLPREVKLALASRGEPRLRLGRLRAGHRLLELGPTELAMSVYEAHQLLAAAGVQAAEETIEQLVNSTEGWPAALYLASVSLRSGTAGAPEDARLASEDHVIAEYVREEVLAPLTPDAQRLLIRSAVLDQLSGELCDVVLERHGSARTLRELAATTSMLIPQDPAHGWYRCHAVLHRVLRCELEMCDASEIRPLHARASDWFAAHGETDRALDHVVAAADADSAGRLLWEHAPRFLYGQYEPIERWLRAFTPEEIASSPRLSLAAAHGHLGAGDLPAARHWARVAADSFEHAADDGQPSSLRAGVCLIEAASGSGGIEQMAASAERAHALEGDAGSLRPLCCLLRGVAMHLLGMREDAREYLGEAVDGCAREMPSAEALGLTQLALMDIEDQDWARAEDRVDRARSCLAVNDLDARPTAALTLATSALVKGRRGVADQAKRELNAAAHGLESLGEYMPWYEVETRIVMARASTRLADVARSRLLLSQASRWARRTRPVPCFVQWLDDAWGDIDDVSAAALSGPGSLTMAELRVLRFLPTHLSFREIGERLHVSGNTVKSQAHAVYAKLGAGSRSEAVAHASALGLIDAQVI
jgi:LuxR family transcriptional regulator, maltose regulon positive regulatory protein